MKKNKNVGPGPGRGARRGDFAGDAEFQGVSECPCTAMMIFMYYKQYRNTPNNLSWLQNRDNDSEDLFCKYS